MSFTVTFYSFAKRVNSTKQPATGTDYDCIIKSPCSTVNPAIQLDLGKTMSPAAWNYCYIPSFGRLYWIKDWVYEDGLWTALCKSDPMGSFKNAIGSYSAYVLRSASQYDGNVQDLYYPMLADMSEVGVGSAQDPGWVTNWSSGQFVIGIMGKNSGPNGGAVTYYAISSSGMQAITDYLLDESHYTNVTDITPDLLKCIFNPLQYIVSCMWFPFTVASLGSISLEVGWWTISGVNAAKISNSVETYNLSFTLPTHPQAATRGNYLNAPPFSRYTVYAGPWGVIPVDAANIIGKTAVSFVMKVDLFTGTGRLSMTSGGGALTYVEDHVTQIGVPVSLGQNVINQGALMQVATAGGEIFDSVTHLKLGAAMNTEIETVGSVAALSQSVPSVVGSNGSMAFNTQFRLVGRFMKIADEDRASRGRPLLKVKTISSLSGYIQCVDADPAIACTDTELSEIVNYMNSGFYYE